MAQYYNYVGVGGTKYGTQFPSAGNGTLATSEVVLAQTPLPDLRSGNQGGVLITAFIEVGASTAGIGSVYLRQSTLGTTATTGAMLGTRTDIPVATSAGAGYSFAWVDYTGTNPIPSYQLTAAYASGSGTILAAVVTATPIGN